MNPSDYVRPVDRDTERAVPLTERFRHRLIDSDSGSTGATVTYIRTPPEGGSPEGTHTHDMDQYFYVLEGTMNFEVDGAEFQAGPGSLVFFPVGVPHRNWNAGETPTVHLAINTPEPS